MRFANNDPRGRDRDGDPRAALPLDVVQGLDVEAAQRLLVWRESRLFWLSLGDHWRRQMGINTGSTWSQR